MTQPDDETDFFFEGESFTFTFEEDVDGSSSNKPIRINNPDFEVVKKKKSAGCNCTKCGEFYDYAEPNQKDGTFKCWGCRH